MHPYPVCFLECSAQDSDRESSSYGWLATPHRPLGPANPAYLLFECAVPVVIHRRCELAVRIPAIDLYRRNEVGRRSGRKLSGKRICKPEVRVAEGSSRRGQSDRGAIRCSPRKRLFENRSIRESRKRPPPPRMLVLPVPKRPMQSRIGVPSCCSHQWFHIRGHQASPAYSTPGGALGNILEWTPCV